MAYTEKKLVILQGSFVFKRKRRKLYNRFHEMLIVIQKDHRFSQNYDGELSNK